jgi:hypothetical protein
MIGARKRKIISFKAYYTTLYEEIIFKFSKNTPFLRFESKKMSPHLVAG